MLHKNVFIAVKCWFVQVLILKFIPGNETVSSSPHRSVDRSVVQFCSHKIDPRLCLLASKSCRFCIRHKFQVINIQKY